MNVLFRHDVLRQRRKDLGLTQEMLAELCGCSPRYLRDLETGTKHNPSAMLVRRMAFVLQIPVEDLLILQMERSWEADARLWTMGWYPA